MANGILGHYNQTTGKPKAVFPSQDRAEIGAKKWSEIWGVPQKAYFCSVCMRWHIGHAK